MLRLAARRAASQVQHYAAISTAPARGFAAEAAPAQSADLDWDALSESITSENGRRELAQLRSTFLDIGTKMDSLTKEAEPIHWAKWKEELDPKLVAKFEEAYKTMPVAKYEDSGLAEVETAFNDLLKQAGELSEHSKARMKDIDEEIKAVDNEMAKMKSLTIDEVLSNEPELGKQLHAEISQGKFIP